MSELYNFKENIKKEELENIAKVINNGGVVVFPTETVYGIGADATNPDAVKKIFEAKGRPQDNPLIVHISNKDMLKDIVEDANEIETKLMDAFWPGPLTIILKSKGVLPMSVTAGLDTVGIRMPDNKIALSIIEESKKPVAAPSANVSGRPSGTNVEDIYNELKDRVDIFVDGGDTIVGIESTVLKVVDGVVTILRPGKISLEDIKALGIECVLDKHIFEDVKEGEKVESPGMKHRHYAPKTKTILVENDEDEKMLQKINTFIVENVDKIVGVVCFSEHKEKIENMGAKAIEIGSKEDLNTISRKIFTTLRNIDKEGVDICLIEGVKKEYIGTGIMNRVIRACEYNVL